MFNIVLYQPQIASNTGAIIRLCANSGCHLHLIKPYAFDLDDKKLRRAGLDYHEFANIKIWDNIGQLLNCSKNRFYFFSTKTKQLYHEIQFQENDYLIFGSETSGLNSDIYQNYSQQLYRLPMKEESRSMNLANSVSIVVYEAWRQQFFLGSV